MSFRIEDILKKDSVRRENNEKTKNSDDEIKNNLNSGSILQQTLLNKVNPYFAQNEDYYLSAERFYSFVNHERLSFVDNYPTEFNIGNPYISLYSKNYCFSNSTYNSIPFLLRMTSKRKGGQVRFTTMQTDTLEKRFNSHKYLSPEDRRILADSLKLSDKQVKTWFQNRRAKWRRYYNGTINGDLEKF